MPGYIYQKDWTDFLNKLNDQLDFGATGVSKVVPEEVQIDFPSPLDSSQKDVLDDYMRLKGYVFTSVV